MALLAISVAGPAPGAAGAPGGGSMAKAPLRTSPPGLGPHPGDRPRRSLRWTGAGRGKARVHAPEAQSGPVLQRNSRLYQKPRQSDSGPREPIRRRVTPRRAILKWCGRVPLLRDTNLGSLNSLHLIFLPFYNRLRGTSSKLIGGRRKAQSMSPWKPHHA
jgi:hypothetical protein